LTTKIFDSPWEWRVKPWPSNRFEVDRSLLLPTPVTAPTKLAELLKAITNF